MNTDIEIGSLWHQNDVSSWAKDDRTYMLVGTMQHPYAMEKTLLHLVSIATDETLDISAEDLIVDFQKIS